MQTTFVSNIDACRLEAELSSEDGEVMALVFEDSVGWHLELLTDDPLTIPSEFVDEVKNTMSHYVNRIGSFVPERLTRGDLALWLMLKDDGTAMGMPYA